MQMLVKAAASVMGVSLQSLLGSRRIENQLGE
jgi:hypothetical protein